jgi:hypothetical protein
MFQDLFKTLNMERVIGLLCLAIMDRHSWLNQSFVTGYLQCLLADIVTNIDIEHCETYYEINIRQNEFGSVSLWKRVQKTNGKPPQNINIISFV